MTDAELQPASHKDDYVRAIEDANRRWKSTAEAVDGKYALQLARPDGDQSPAALHSQYLRQREAERSTWQRATAAAMGTYRGRTGHQELPKVGWTPNVPEPLPGPGQRPAAVGRPNPAGEKRRARRRWIVVAGSLSALFVVVALATSGKPSTDRSASSALTSDLSSTVQVLYEVEGTATGANLTMETSSGTSQQNDKAVPLISKSTGKRGLTQTMNRGDFVYLSAQNKGAKGTITCRISVDGVVVSTNTSSGGYAIASCDGTAR